MNIFCIEDYFQQERLPNHRYISNTGVALAIGDQVRLHTNAKTGKKGDIAVVLAFLDSPGYVKLTLLGTGETATRHPKNLTIHKYI